jgi:hypothetical protein
VDRFPGHHLRQDDEPEGTPCSNPLRSEHPNPRRNLFAYPPTSPLNPRNGIAVERVATGFEETAPLRSPARGLLGLKGTDYVLTGRDQKQQHGKWKRFPHSLEHEGTLTLTGRRQWLGGTGVPGQAANVGGCVPGRLGRGAARTRRQGDSRSTRDSRGMDTPAVRGV